MAVLGEVPNLPGVVARAPNWRELLWWTSCHLLLWCRWSMTVLLLLLELWAVAPELQRSARLSRGWCVNHAVLQGTTAKTISGESWHGLFFLFS
jgi:hypothetical protein